MFIFCIAALLFFKYLKAPHNLTTQLKTNQIPIFYCLLSERRQTLAKDLRMEVIFGDPTLLMTAAKLRSIWQ